VVPVALLASTILLAQATPGVLPAQATPGVLPASAAAPARPPAGAVAAGDTKTACIYVDPGAGLRQAERATGLTYRCLEVFVTGSSTWSAWAGVGDPPSDAVSRDRRGAGRRPTAAAAPRARATSAA
jgi:hypothetical protein